MEIFDTVGDLAIGEESIMYEYLNTERKQRVIRPSPDQFAMWDSKEFQHRFRLLKESVLYLLPLTSDQIKYKTQRRAFIQLPRGSEEIRKTQEEFYKIARFPRVISAIDCTHIKIQSPGGNIAEEF
ncbi:unnamed protein product, partial [Brenthis ino]